MNFVIVKNGLLNLDNIVYVNRDKYSIALVNGETLVVREDEIEAIYTELLNYIADKEERHGLR